MITINPSIFLRRLSIHKGDHIAYDEKFHRGLNVIRGENSSGKSTIMDFIFYILGGNITAWRNAASVCDRVIAEVEFSGVPLTLRRYVEEQSLRPMMIYWGPYEDAVKDVEEKWEVFPFVRREKESFSQVLFRVLGFPEARGEGSSNITMHQVLRLLYSDQMSPIDDIFRFDQWDNAVVRESVGAFLCGAYDPSVYDAKIELQKLTKRFDEVKGRLDGLFRAYGHIKHGLTMDWVKAEERQLLVRRHEIENELSAFRNAQREAIAAVTDQRVVLSELSEQLRNLDIEISNISEEISNISYEKNDSELFVADIRRNLKAIEHSYIVRSSLGDVLFENCPACLSPLAGPVDGHCGLCHSPLDQERQRAQIARLQRDLEAQVRESDALNRERGSRLKSLQQKLFQMQQQREKLSAEYRLSADSLAHPLEQQAEKLARESGYIERRIDELGEQAKVALSLEELSVEKADLQSQISTLNDRISAGLAVQEERKSSAYTLVADMSKKFLKDDLEREEAFIKSRYVQFSFEKNNISVDGNRMFAASSMVYLKNSFHLGLFAASLKDPNFRAPRFAMFDNVEDKGMEPERSKNFQKIIAHVCEESEVNCQVIMTTSMVAEELNIPPYTVGDFYTHENRALKGISA